MPLQGTVFREPFPVPLKDLDLPVKENGHGQAASVWAEAQGTDTFRMDLEFLNLLARAYFPDMKASVAFREKMFRVGTEDGSTGNGGAWLRIGEKHSVRRQVPHPHGLSTGLVASGRS